jgi:hypothetical protein
MVVVGKLVRVREHPGLSFRPLVRIGAGRVRAQRDARPGARVTFEAPGDAVTRARGYDYHVPETPPSEWEDALRMGIRTRCRYGHDLRLSAAKLPSRLAALGPGQPLYIGA